MLAAVYMLSVTYCQLWAQRLLFLPERCLANCLVFAGRLVRRDEKERDGNGCGTDGKQARSRQDKKGEESLHILLVTNDASWHGASATMFIGGKSGQAHLDVACSMMLWLTAYGQSSPPATAVPELKHLSCCRVGPGWAAGRVSGPCASFIRELLLSVLMCNATAANGGCRALADCLVLRAVDISKSAGPP